MGCIEQLGPTLGTSGGDALGPPQVFMPAVWVFLFRRCYEVPRQPLPKQPVSCGPLYFLKRTPNEKEGSCRWKMTQDAASSAAATRYSGDRATADAGHARQAAPGSRVAAVFGPGGHFLVAALVRLLGRQIVRGARDADLHIEDEAAVDERVDVVPPHPVFYIWAVIVL